MLHQRLLGVFLALAAAPAASLAPRAASPHLAITVQPTSTTAGTAIAPAVKAQLLDANGLPLATSGVRVQVGILNNPGNVVLFGKLKQVTSGGVATFPDLAVDKAGAGYRLELVAEGYDGVLSDPFDIAPGAPARVAFQSNPNFQPAWNTLPPIQVGVLDAFGNAVGNANIPVTVSLAANPGVNLVHASGSIGNPVFELVDPVTPALLPPVLNPGPISVSAMVYDPTLGKLIVADLANSLSHVDPATGSQQFVGTPGVLPTAVKGLSIDPGRHTLLAVLITDGNLYCVNPTTAAPALVGTVAIPGDALVNMSGFAMHPLTGQYFAIAQLVLAPNPDDRALITVDPHTLSATFVGFTHDKFAGLAFLPDGTLIGVTGDGGLTAEKLFRIDPATGATTPLLALGNGDSGECITTIPAQLRGTLTKNPSGGVATFGDLRVTAPAAGYQLLATAPGCVSAVGRAFDAAAPNLSGVVQFATASQSVAENVGTVSVGLTLNPTQAHDVVAWVRVTGSASPAGFPGADMTLNGFIDIPVTIPAGQPGTTLSFQVIDDAATEPNETVVITLGRAALGTVGAQTVHTVTILAND